MLKSPKRLAVMTLSAIVGFGAVGASMPVASVAAASPGFQQVGQLKISDYLSDVPQTGTGHGSAEYYDQSTFLLDVPARRGYQLVGFRENGTTYSTEVTVYDLDRLTAIKSAVLHGLMPAQLTATADQSMPFSNYVAALAPQQSRLYFVLGNSVAATGFNPYDIAAMDLSSLNVTDVPMSDPSACLSDGIPYSCPVYGLSFDPRSGMLYELSASASLLTGLGPGQYTLQVSAIDPKATSPVKGTAQLPSACDGAPSYVYGQHLNPDPAPIFRSTDGASLFTACSTQHNTDGGSNGVVAAVKVPLDGNALPQATGVSLYPSTHFVSQVYADPAADRLDFVLNILGDKNILIFDGRMGDFVGEDGLDKVRLNANQAPVNSPAFGVAIDESSGRIYYGSYYGFFLIDGRRTDRQGFPQAQVFPTGRADGFADRALAVDWKTHRVFVPFAVNQLLGGDGSGQSLDHYYTIFQDTTPVSQDVPLDSLDAGTEDIPATPGGTVVQYAGHAQGFGSRTYNVQPSDLGGAVQGQSTGPLAGTREVLDGRLRGADLTGNGAEGVGATLDADSTTRADYENNTQQAWPYNDVKCNDTGTRDAESSNDPGGSTSLTCDLKNGSVVGSSDYAGNQAVNQASGVGTGAAHSHIDVNVSLVPNQSTSAGKVQAVVSTATATVEGIQLAPGVSIGSLTITATAYAGGRHGTAGTTVTRTFQNVKAGTFSCPTNCDPTAVLIALNTALAQQMPGQVQIVMPNADPVAGAGTPHGYYAAVLKDTGRFLNDWVINFDTRPEVVGLEEIRVNDDLFTGSPARQITEYGGIDVEARYGITSIDDGALGGGDNSADSPGSIATGTSGTTDVAPPQGSVVVPRSPSKAVPSQATGFTGLVDSVLRGFSVLLDPRQLPLMLLMWVILIVPGYLATRRRRLTSLGL